MTTNDNTSLEKTQEKIETPAARFTGAVMRELSSVMGQEVSMDPFQKKLVQNYFIKLDMLLQDNEIKRMAKSESYRDPIPYTWQNINLQRLAIDVVTFSSVGLDPTQPNHLNLIPYANKKTGRYDIGFIMGYKGIELKSRKYGLDIPTRVTVELIRKNDKFKQYKKDKDNDVESYSFDVIDPFDRGVIIGGFYYHDYECDPKKNELRVFTLADIEKRKPKNASAEFWGGTKDNWVYDDQKQRNVKQGTVEVEGWFEEMAYKTIYRAAWNKITIDSQKIDAAYLKVIEREAENRDAEIAETINDNANQGPAIGFKDEEHAEYAEEVTQDENDGSSDAIPVTEIKSPLGSIKGPNTIEKLTEAHNSGNGKQMTASF